MHDPPLALYVWGNLSEKDNHAVSMVGAKGRTIAVIGSGLGQIYPPGNMALAEKIASTHGAVVSEFPLSTRPDKKTFPMRNRIVAAWGEALVVVECPKWSGSMITANLAGEMGRPIYAVPGPIDRPTSDGCNHLIREGATLLSKAEDLLEDFSQLPLSDHPVLFEQTHKRVLPELSVDEEMVYACLGREDMALDSVTEQTKLPMSQLLPALLKLEMKKLIKQLPGPRYVRTA